MVRYYGYYSNKARSKKINLRKAIPSHALLFIRRLSGLKAPKKYGTPYIVPLFFLTHKGIFSKLITRKSGFLSLTSLTYHYSIQEALLRKHLKMGMPIS